jgi:hypothetical protein
MTMTMAKRTITCFCENTFEADVPETVDLSSEPHVIEEVLRGDFMTVKCPLCGKRLAPEFPCLFLGARGERDIFFVPELDRVAYLRGKLPYDSGRPWRIVIGFSELVEKLRVVKLDLDDRVLEIMKYYLLTRSDGVSTAGKKRSGEVTAMYGGDDGDRMVFHLNGIREGEIAIARLPRDIYSKIKADVEKRMKEEPFSEFCSPPYVSVRRIV